MLQGTVEDTLLIEWFDSTAIANIGLLKEVADSADTDPEYAFELNESITPDNQAEENEQIVNSIYLVTWAVDIFDLTNEQYETLYGIAMENPVTSGSGVYASRVMLGLIVDDDDEGGSRLANANNESKSNSSIVDEKIKLIPNPAKLKTVYLNKLRKDEKGWISMHNKLGYEMQTHELFEGDNSIGIDLQQMSAGIYYIKTEINSKVTDVRKIVVIK